MSAANSACAGGFSRLLLRLGLLKAGVFRRRPRPRSRAAGPAPRRVPGPFCRPPGTLNASGGRAGAHLTFAAAGVDGCAGGARADFAPQRTSAGSPNPRRASGPGAGAAPPLAKKQGAIALHIGGFVNLMNRQCESLILKANRSLV